MSKKIIIEIHLLNKRINQRYSDQSYPNKAKDKIVEVNSNIDENSKVTAPDGIFFNGISRFIRSP